MNLTITAHKEATGIDVLALTGRITLGRNNGQLESAVVELLAAGASKIVIDLSGVTYVDSSGVGSIAVSASKAKASKAALVVAGANGMIGEIFRITRVDLLVPFFPDLASAMASFTG